MAVKLHAIGQFKALDLTHLRVYLLYLLGLSTVSFGGVVDIGLRRGVVSYLILATVLLLILSALTWVILLLILRLTKERRNRIARVQQLMEEALRYSFVVPVRRKYESPLDLAAEAKSTLEDDGAGSPARNTIIVNLEEALKLDPDNRDVRFQLMRWRGTGATLGQVKTPIKRLRRFVGYDVFAERYWYKHLIMAVAVGVIAFVLIRINTEASYYIEAGCIQYIPRCADRIGDVSETTAVTRLNDALTKMPIKRDVVTSWKPIDHDTNCYLLHGGEGIGRWGGGGLSARTLATVLENTGQLTEMFLIAYYPTKQRHGALALAVWGLYPPNKQRGWVIKEYSSLAPGGQSCDPSTVN